MDLMGLMNKLEAEVAAGKLSDVDKQRKIDNFMEDYQRSLVQKKAGRKTAKIERSQAGVQTDEELVSGALRSTWEEFLTIKEEQDTRLESFAKMFTNVKEMIERIEKFCGTYQLLWKIKNFGKVLADAREGTKTILPSPIFDSHRNGYKMQLSLCPYGDGKGQNIAMSLFFSILKGNSDSFLRWPFECPITFTLLNQKHLKELQEDEQRLERDKSNHGRVSGHSGGNSRSTDSAVKARTTSSSSRSSGSRASNSASNRGVSASNRVTEDGSAGIDIEAELNAEKRGDHLRVFNPASNPANEAFLLRPVEERNRSIGFQRFILLSDLYEGGYIDNDTIYIKVHVDISEI